MKLIVEQVSEKDVTTRFGAKKTYSFKGSDGQWYSNGFTRPVYVAGDEVEFDFTSSTYGNQVTKGTIRTVGKGSAPVAGSSAPAAPYAAKPYNRNGTFPIEATDGQRSILRQNALTNARELFTCPSAKGVIVDFDNAAKEIVKLARHFEAYTAGDLDREAALKAVKKAGAGKPATPAEDATIPGEGS